MFLQVLTSNLREVRQIHVADRAVLQENLEHRLLLPSRGERLDELRSCDVDLSRLLVDQRPVDFADLIAAERRLNLHNRLFLTQFRILTGHRLDRQRFDDALLELRCDVSLRQESSHHRLHFYDLLHLRFIQSRQIFLVVILQENL